MKGLAGDFGTMPLKELAVYLGNRRATGRLSFHCAQVRKQLVLAEGAIVNASSTEPREYLGQFLINMGHLTEEQAHKAFRTQGETKVFLGRILVMIGLVPEDVVRTALNMKLRETLLEALRWPEGEFHFDPAGRPPKMEGLEVAVELLDVVREGEFRETAWEAIRGAFPSGRLQLEVDEEKARRLSVHNSLDERILQMAREGLSIDDMLMALHSTDFMLYQRLYALYRQEAVRPGEHGGRTPPPASGEVLMGRESEASEVRAHARSFLAQGRTREAEVLARRAYEMEASTEGAELLRQVEEALLRELRGELLEPPRVPSLAVPASSLRGLSLTPAEKYLLSRIDGRRDVEAIVRVSPVRELEALEAFHSFRERGLISLM